jgi:mRNA interferase MazF
MPSMTTYEFGDVVLVPFPFTNQTTSKKRPAIVVSSELYHNQRMDLILIAVTSQIKPTQTFGEVIIQGWQAAGLLKTSLMKPVLMTIENDLVIKPLGTLQKLDLNALEKLLQEVLGGAR